MGSTMQHVARLCGEVAGVNACADKMTTKHARKNGCQLLELQVAYTQHLEPSFLVGRG